MVPSTNVLGSYFARQACVRTRLLLFKVSIHARTVCPPGVLGIMGDCGQALAAARGRNSVTLDSMSASNRIPTESCWRILPPPLRPFQGSAAAKVRVSGDYPIRPWQRTSDVPDARAAREGHPERNILLQEVQHAVDTTFAVHVESPQVRWPDQHGPRSKCQSFQDVGAPADAAVHKQLRRVPPPPPLRPAAPHNWHRAAARYEFDTIMAVTPCSRARCW